MSQTMRRTDNYLCKDGQISLTGSTSVPVSQAPQCPAPAISVSATPKTPSVGTTVAVSIRTRHVSRVDYQCYETFSKQVVKQGQVAVGDSIVNIVVTADVTCDAVGTNSDGVKVVARVDIPIDCGAKIKVNGRCEDFRCREIRTLAKSANGIYEVPPRSADGICYSVKIMNEIPFGDSGLTKTFDQSVVSRNHDNGFENPNDVRNPYMMGRSVIKFRLGGARTVKLSGEGNDLAPILVDNFVLTAIHPETVTNPGAQYFRAYGTADSTVYNTNAVLVNNQQVPVQVFATGGTSTITPLDITTQIQALVTHILDARAMDCGMARQMSDLYVLFQ